MADDYLPAEEVSDYSDVEDDLDFEGMVDFDPDDILGLGDYADYDDDDDDGFLIDEWSVAEEDWVAFDSDSDEEITYIDGLPIRKIFVTNFHAEVTNQDLKTLFSKFGKVSDVSILDGKGSRYSFVTFASPENATLALRAKPKELQLRWNALKVFPAHSWHQPREAKANKWKRDVSETKGECFINKLNDDCLLYILKLLPVKEQVKLERVCKRWQGLSQSLWLRRNSFDLNKLSDDNYRFSVPAFRKVLRYCGNNLTSLDFTQLKSDSLSAVLPLISQNCANLEVLKLSEITINTCALNNLGVKCKNLRHLMLQSCPGLKDKEVGKLLSRLEKLEHLDLSKNTTLIGGFLNAMKPGVASLILDECNNLALKNLLTVLQKPNCGITMLSLSSCQTLTTLDIQNISQAAAKTLKELRLNNYFPRLKPSSLKVLGGLTELTKLILQFNSCLSKEALLEISQHCTKLEELDISGSEQRDQPSRFADMSIEAISYLPKLQVLNISYMMYTDAALDALALRAKLLRILNCMGCPNITNQGTANLLAKCNRLEMLDLSGCYIGPEILDAAALSVVLRKEKIKLTLFVGGTEVMKAHADKVIEPLLDIQLFDHSIRHLRPDFNDDIYFDPFHIVEDDFENYDSDDSLNEEDIQMLINLFAVV